MNELLKKLEMWQARIAGNAVNVSMAEQALESAIAEEKAASAKREKAFGELLHQQALIRYAESELENVKTEIRNRV